MFVVAYDSGALRSVTFGDCLLRPVGHNLGTVHRQVARISHVAQESQTESQGRPENLGGTGPAPIPKAFPYAVASLTDGAQTTMAYTHAVTADEPRSLVNRRFSSTDTIVDNAWSRKLGVDGC